MKNVRKVHAVRFRSIGSLFSR